MISSNGSSLIEHGVPGGLDPRDRPFASVIVPCRNEARFIGACLDSIIENDYPKERLEVLVVDGMSEDATRTVVEACARRYLFITVLDNPERTTSTALNTGIATARGDIIIWMSAHNWYAKDYISRSVEYLRKYAADNIGGVIITLPREPTLIGRAIASCLSHRFGVGHSFFRVHANKPKWVDTVFGGCYRRDVFDRVGLFNERLTRGQDIEFNLRLKQAGGRILLAPDVVSYYYARSDMKSFWRHNWSNGVWAILPFLYSDIMPVSPRHLVPLAFVLGLLGSVALALAVPVGVWMLLGVGGTYAAANLAASLETAVKLRDVRYLVVMPVIFASLHLAYGLGSSWGIIKVLKHTLPRLGRKARELSRPC